MLDGEETAFDTCRITSVVLVVTWDVDDFVESLAESFEVVVDGLTRLSKNCEIAGTDTGVDSFVAGERFPVGFLLALAPLEVEVRRDEIFPRRSWNLEEWLAKY